VEPCHADLHRDRSTNPPQLKLAAFAVALARCSLHPRPGRPADRDFADGARPTASGSRSSVHSPVPRSLWPELALDDDQRHVLEGHLDRMRMTELMPRKPAPLITQNSGATGSPSRTALDGSSCSQAHSSIPTRGAGRRCRGTSTDPATAIQTGLGEGKRLVDAKARAITRRSARAAVVGADRRGGARDRDNLLDRRRIGGITHTLVAWRTSCTESGHRRRRPATTSSMEQQLGHDAPSRPRTKLGSTHLRVAASNRAGVRGSCSGSQRQLAGPTSRARRSAEAWKRQR
jgi:hypothetical protein